MFHKFVDGIKRQAKINAAIRYIEGDFTKIEKEHWDSLFTEKIEPLTNEEKSHLFLGIFFYETPCTIYI